MARFWERYESDGSIYTDSEYDDDEEEEESLPCKPRWFRPASRPVDGDEPASPPRPETVLLDTLVYIDGERNATTASAARTNGHSIQVTFRIACPPRLSHLAVYCPGQPDAIPTLRLPRVVATEDDLALLRLRVPVYPEQVRRHDRRNEFFVYRAGAGDRPPILCMIPNPNTLCFADKEVGILSCRTDDRFFIAVLNQDLCRPTPARYIHLFDSKNWAWSTKQVYLRSPKTCSHTSTSKVIAMGGKRGSIGWVDLWHGILVYDVLPGNDKVRCIPLPSPRRQFALESSPGTVRDITVVNGVIKYFVMYSPGVHTTNVVGDWHADTWKMKQPWKKWQHEFHLKASEIRVDGARHSELLRGPAEENDAERKKPVLTRLRAGSPVLSMQDDDVLYVLTKPMYQETKAWVIAVDMNTKTLQGVDEFDAGRTIGLMFTPKLRVRSLDAW